ncbi:MAG: lactonase family protein [Candidatus Lokiarchaeota archaeon]|nr:lactonase family protein [Candidatus Lokiarchaeota archaeon]
MLADERLNPRILTWSPDGKYLVTLGRWCEMFWNTSTWTLEFILHEDPAWFVTPGSGVHLHFSPDSTRLYVLSSSDVVAWDVPGRRLAWKTAREDRAHAISIDAACTVILCDGGRLSDARTGAWRRAGYPSIPGEHPGGEAFVALSPDGRLVATISRRNMKGWNNPGIR